MQEFYAPGLNFYSNQHFPPPSQHTALDFICKCLEMVQLLSPSGGNLQNCRCYKSFVADSCQLICPGNVPFFLLNPCLIEFFSC